MINFEDIDVQTLLDATAPERWAKLRKLWEEYKFNFRLAHDQARFTLETSPSMIIATRQTLAQMWLLAYAAWRAIEAYSGVLLLLRLNGLPFNWAEVGQLHGQSQADSRLAAALLKARELGCLEQLEHFTWPEGIPTPDQKTFGSVEDRAAHDLALFARAFAVLHEMKHFMYEQKPVKRPSEQDEHVICDEFAADFLVGRIDEYAPGHNWSPADVLRKRAIGMAVSAFLLLERTPSDRWCGSESHPSLTSRLRRIVASVDLPADDHFWFCSASLLVAKLREEGKLPESIAFADMKHLTSQLIASVEG
jgi:Peptidase U49